VTDTQHRPAEGLPLEAARIDDRSNVGDSRVLEDLELARLGVDLDFGKADNERTRLTIALVPGLLPAPGVSAAIVTITAPGATNPTLTLPVSLSCSMAGHMTGRHLSRVSCRGFASCRRSS